MNRAELINAISEDSDIMKKDVDAMLHSFTKVVTDQLKKREKVQLVGFGTFEVARRASRIGKNPRTGKEMKIKSSYIPKFKAGKLLREDVNK